MCKKILLYIYGSLKTVRKIQVMNYTKRHLYSLSIPNNLLKWQNMKNKTITYDTIIVIHTL